MARYRKSIVALLALLVIAAKEIWGVDLGLDPGGLVDVAINLGASGVAAVGVYGVPNA